MPDRQVVGGLGLRGGWSPGEDGWGDEMNANLIKISVLCGFKCKARLTTALPTNGTTGDVYIVSNTAGNTVRNSIAAWVGVSGAQRWQYFTPIDGLPYWDDTNNHWYQYRANITLDPWVRIDNADAYSDGVNNKFLTNENLYEELENILREGSNITLNRNDATKQIEIVSSGGGGVSDLSSFDTDDLDEGRNNLYHTALRVFNTIVAGTGLVKGGLVNGMFTIAATGVAATKRSTYQLLKMILQNGMNNPLTFDDTTYEITVNDTGGSGVVTTPRIAEFSISDFDPNNPPPVGASFARQFTITHRETNEMTHEELRIRLFRDNLELRTSNLVSGSVSETTENVPLNWVTGIFQSNLNSIQAGYTYRYVLEIFSSQDPSTTIASREISISYPATSEQAYFGTLTSATTPNAATFTNLTLPDASGRADVSDEDYRFNINQNWDDDDYLYILIPANRDLSHIDNAGHNYIGDFTKLENVRTINSQQYHVYFDQNNSGYDATALYEVY